MHPGEFMPDEYQHKKGIVFKNQYHVIFCPKYRRKVLTDGVDVRLKEILLAEAGQLEGTAINLSLRFDCKFCPL